MADAMLTSEAWHKWKRKLLTEEEASDKKVETTLIKSKYGFAQRTSLISNNGQQEDIEVVDIISNKRQKENIEVIDILDFSDEDENSSKSDFVLKRESFDSSSKAKKRG